MARVYRANLAFMMDVSELIRERARRRGKERAFARAFRDMEKLDTIYRRWQGKMDYIFDWGRPARGVSREEILALLNEQIPVTEAYADALKKTKIAREKADKEAKQVRRKTKNQPEKAEKNIVEESAVPMPPAPADSFHKAIYEYNLEIYANCKDRRQAVRDIEKFKNDMVMFVQIVEQFREGVSAFQIEFPDGLELEYRRSGGSGAVPLRRSGPRTKKKKK